MPLLRRLRSRYEALARELAKFGIVGGFCASLDVALLNLLVFRLDVQPLRAKLVAAVVATTTAYLLNRYWTFRRRTRQDVHREYLLFFGLNVAGLGINLAVLALARYGLGLDGVLALNAANLVGIAVATAFRFWGYRKLVWTAPGAVIDAAGAAAVVLDRSHGEADPAHR